MDLAVPQTPLLEARGLTLFKGRAAWNWSLGAGERWGILGAPGSGKSTLLRVLAHLHAPTSGTLWWKGIEVNAKSRKALKELGTWVTLLYPNPYTALEPWQSVRSYFSPEMLALENWSAWSGLSPAMLDYPVRILSGTIRARLMALRALAVHPFILLVDDWSANLMPEAYAQLMTQLDGHLGVERALVVASQQPGALRSFPLWMVLDQGTLVEWGTQAAIVADPVHPETQALLNGSVLVKGEKNEREGVWAEVSSGHWVRR